MSGKRFTPAPWKRAMNLSRNGSGKPRGLSFSRIVDANNQTVAYAYQRASRMEQVGNVNLISAAPDMYAFLEKLVNQIEENGLMQYDAIHNGVNWVLEEAKELLRKARGESEVQG